MRLDRIWPGCAASTTAYSANGYCTRPPELDCTFESICEICAFFQTSIEFRPTTLQRQHDDAAAKGQHHRADLFHQLLNKVNGTQAS